MGKHIELLTVFLYSCPLAIVIIISFIICAKRSKEVKETEAEKREGECRVH